MKLKTIFIISWLLFTASAATAQPSIELPPEEPKQAIPRVPMLQLQRENQIEVPLYQPAPANSTAIGGYGELTFNAPSNGPNIVDMRRMVLFIGHNFTDKLRFYGELELEHAITSASDVGEFELEQAFLDYLAWKPLNFRAGVILIPMGIINIYHEPSTFNGVDRPETDTVIIPSTWREPGAGVFGDVRGLRYQAYVINGFKANGFTASNGVRDGHQEAALALGHDWGLIARADYGLPFLYKYRITADVGASFYYSHADQGQALFKGAEGDSVPVTMLDVDLRLRTRGLEFRGELATAWIGGIHRLNRALADAALAAMTTFEGPVAHQLIGGYVELGYNVLHPLKLRSGLQLVPFLRYEHVDTQYQLPSDLARAPGNNRDIVTAGLTFRPIAEIALKFDYQRVSTDATAAADQNIDRYNVGLAFMF
ncbi:MAG: hypothetical protein JWN44_5834 [Myxococcales bacterium]|nr:hypothetical protein [Myxococcales bacterium]